MDKVIDAIVIFVDIRGFTEWSDTIVGNRTSGDLVKKFYAEIQKQFDEFANNLPKINNIFSKYTFKPNGDGAMIVVETTTQDSGDLIDYLIQTIDDINKGFALICSDIQKISGQETSLFLGWGITRGAVKEIEIEKSGNVQIDHIGSTINRASRLCNLARPFGIVMGRPMFTPPDTKRFFEDELEVKGIDKPIKCWVSNEVKSKFVKREIRKETPEVHVAGVCYKEVNGKYYYLIAKRNKERKLYPEKYECCGGQLRPNELFQTGVVRHFRTEMGITIKVLDMKPFLYKIEEGDELINGLCFCCKHIEGEPNSQNHIETKWVSLEEINSMSQDDFILDFLKELKFFAELIEKKQN